MDAVLKFINENPKRFLNGRVITELDGKKCIISRDNIKGGIIVSYAGEILGFNFDKKEQKWH